MRTFPRELARFRELVNERGALLRKRSFDELLESATTRQGRFPEPVVIDTESLTVGPREATISTWVKLRPDGTLGVVLQGFMEHSYMPGMSVALDGFCKHSDGSVSELPENELYDFE